MIVTAADSASAQLAIVPDVLASARMISFIESVCAELMLEHLAPGEMSVGVGFDLTHEAPTPIGMRIFASVEVVEVNKRTAVFQAIARDEVEIIGRGRHTRAVIDVERFMRRVKGKQAPR
jgi:fluoroacetyl-CoA thioesterase